MDRFHFLLVSMFLAAGTVALPATLLAVERSDTTLRPIAIDSRYDHIWTGQVVGSSKARQDSVYILGGPDRQDGKFQDSNGQPDNQGWFGFSELDAVGELPHWHIDPFNAELLDSGTPNHAMWCGAYFDACGPDDPGYGNNWADILAWFGTVPDPALPVTVYLTARLNYDTEPAYDFLHLQVARDTGWESVQTYDGNNKVGGIFVPVDVIETFVVNPDDYTGTNYDQVHLRWFFQSDGGWSDEDCLHDTDGAAQVDNITVSFAQGGPPVLVTEDDFEPGSDVHWNPSLVSPYCSYAQVWPLLNDLDPAHDNLTPQFAFVDDGSQCGGPGSPGVVWTYGPGGYVVHYQSSLGPDIDIIVSPPLEWPGAVYDGAQLACDIYTHEGGAGQFYLWHIRSSTDGGETWGSWEDFNFVYYMDEPEYRRAGWDVSGLLLPELTHVQIAFGHIWLGWVWGAGTDYLTPAPYFDNVSLQAFQIEGPVISATDMHLAQDNFPASGTIDYADLGANNVRFDMARNISPPSHQQNSPGDSIICDVGPARIGASLVDRPKMHYKLRPNPLFDPYRTSGLPVESWVYGDTTRTAMGTIIPDRYNFDLPDAGFFFPGDVIHYYFEAQDDVGGNIATTLLPGDTTGYYSFEDNSPYPAPFTVRALPTIHSATPDDHPPVLFWDDFTDAARANEWFFALHNFGQRGQDYDMYSTNQPTSGLGNGLGGRATLDQISGYETIIYSSGSLDIFTITNVNYNLDAGDDVGLLDSWLRLGDKSMLLCGNHLISDLVVAGEATSFFVTDWIGVDFVDDDLAPLIDNQANPTVKTLPGNPVFFWVDEWIACGGMHGPYTFDAVEITGQTLQLAEFTDPDGNIGLYPYAAATLQSVPDFGAEVVFLPYDLSFVYTAPPGAKAPPGSAARTQMLEDILLYFGHLSLNPVTPVPGRDQFLVRTYPNPFNPSTKIEYHMPERGELDIRIYNLRGELVRTLRSGVVAAGDGFVIWDGSDDANRSVSSGVYFYEAKARDETTVQKMMLVK